MTEKPKQYQRTAKFSGNNRAYHEALIDVADRAGFQGQISPALQSELTKMGLRSSDVLEVYRSRYTAVGVPRVC